MDTNFLLVLISSGIFCCVPTILLGLSGRGGGCFAMILAVSVHNNRTSVFLLNGSFHWMGDFIGKHFLGRVPQDLLGCNTFGYGVQHVRNYGPSAPLLQNKLGLGLWCSPGFLICLANVPPHSLKQSGVSGCCLNMPSGLLAFYFSL